MSGLCCCRMSGNSFTQLLQLPDPCLVGVLKYCAGDLRSLFSSARAHSRLHQAAVLALTSISKDRVTPQQAAGLVQYLSTLGQNVGSIALVSIETEWRKDRMEMERIQTTLCELPPNLQLQSLSFTNMRLQLQRKDGLHGVVRRGVPLKQLCLHDCRLLDATKGLAAALALLTGLEHLSIRSECRIPQEVLPRLQQLTYHRVLSLLAST